MNDVMQLLHETSPFEGFNTASFPVDLQGWGSDDAIFAQAIATKRPKIIVEVGTWKGRSAINMAKIVKSLGLDCTIICVDTWLGSPEHFLGGDPAWRTSLLFKHGYPQLYFTFLSNVIHSNVTDIIVPLPTTSENAAIILKAKGIRPDMVYVDGAHEEAPAYRDFKTYFDLLSPRGNSHRRRLSVERRGHPRGQPLCERSPASDLRNMEQIRGVALSEQRAAHYFRRNEHVATVARSPPAVRRPAQIGCGRSEPLRGAVRAISSAPVEPLALTAMPADT